MSHSARFTILLFCTALLPFLAFGQLIQVPVPATLNYGVVKPGSLPTSSVELNMPQFQPETMPFMLQFTPKSSLFFGMPILFQARLPLGMGLLQPTSLAPVSRVELFKNLKNPLKGED